MESRQGEFMEHIANLYPQFTKEKQCWPGVGSGWFGILEEFYREMNSRYHASENKAEWIDKFEIRDIKEKFGYLSVYYSAIQTREQFERANEILCKSITVCEICGEPGKLRMDLSWFRTLCEKHYQQKKDRENNR